MKKRHSILKKSLLVIYDIFATYAAGFLSNLIFSIENPGAYFKEIVIYTSIIAVLTVFGFTIFKLYSSVWRYASIAEVLRIFTTILIILVLNILVMLIIKRYIPIRWCIIVAMLQVLFTTFPRFLYRFSIYLRNGEKSFIKTNTENKIRVMVVGAGESGHTIIKEMINVPTLNMVPICAIDDDEEKMNRYILNVKIVGNVDDIPKMALKYNIDQIIIAIPSINAKRLSIIINICQDTKCKIKIIPGIYQLVNSEVSLGSVRDVDIQDLLGREPILVNLDEINGYINNEVVMVTGGGGSIGSELCRQIAKSSPKKLIIIDIYENNAYDIEQELKRDYPHLDFIVLIASVRDVVKIDNVFQIYRPTIVYHAAAHKHVPLMETSPNEAVKNNVIGTYNVAKCADKYNVKRFIMISTDKAVNPTNIMGATKRICEMIIQTINKHSKTDFVAVRFGNVLGSNGSVIPLFKKQIENGGPVTVTDRNITRYFMTIPEAVMLVLQAGSYAKGGEIFVLDMGEPVKIYDLAVNLIRLSGFTPNVDIKIEIIGLRPGEKLYEELLMDEEGLQETDNKLIHIGKPIDVDEENLFTHIKDLSDAAHEETTKMKELVEELVPTYKVDIR